MKTKLSAQEKARRQDWRDKRYASPSIPRPHHLTREQRKAMAIERPAVQSLSEFVKDLLPVEPKPVKTAKKPYLKVRARRAIGDPTYSPKRRARKATKTA